jgi:uncharacterized protein YbbK (DUF523 family)
MPVRYDGTGKPHAGVQALTDQVEFIALCPELAIGLGVPRPPIQLVLREGEQFALGVEDPLMDVTDALRGYARQVCDAYAGELGGYVCKARSPSCALATTAVFNEKGKQLSRSDGMFIAELVRLIPGLPIVDEAALETHEGREYFLQRVCVYSGIHPGSI